MKPTTPIPITDSIQKHGAIVVGIGKDADGHYARTVGGNESDSICRVRVGVSENSKGVQIAGHQFNFVIADLKT